MFRPSDLTLATAQQGMDIKRPVARNQRHRKLFVAGVVALAFLILAGFALSLGHRAPAVNGDGLWSDTVTRGELVREVSAVGTLVAPELRAVTNRSEGVVEQIRVLPGHLVEADDVLLDMSSPQLENELATARWQLQAAEAEERLLRVELENRYLDSVAQLANAEAEYTSAKLELEAYEQLVDKQVIPEVEARRRRVQADEWLKRLDAERARHANFPEYREGRKSATLARLSQLRQEVSRLESSVQDLHVKAGARGVVQEINVAAGERLAAGEAVARVVNPDHLIARVKVSERDAPQVILGLPVHLEMGQHTVTGKVTRVDPTVRERLVTVDVKLVSDPLPALRPDLSVTARIELERAKDVLVLNRPVGLRDEFQSVSLFVFDPDGRSAKRTKVQVGRTSARQVEIVNGLKAGDKVILADLSEWQGEPVIRIQ